MVVLNFDPTPFAPPFAPDFHQNHTQSPLAVLFGDQFFSAMVTVIASTTGCGRCRALTSVLSWWIQVQSLLSNSLSRCTFQLPNSSKMTKTEFPHNIAILNTRGQFNASQYCAETRF
jgi:hypothetical protein